MRHCLFICCLLACIQACQPTLVAEFQDKAVVEAYLHEGSSPQFRVSQLIPLRSDVVFSDEDINQLDIDISDQTTGDNYKLTPIGEGRYTCEALSLQLGHTYTLHLPYNNQEVTASTDIPPKPDGLKISRSSMGIMARPNIMPAADNEPAEVTWNNPDNNYYLIVVENIEDNPTPIFETEEGTTRPRAFRKEPIQSSSERLSQQDFSYYGKHNVILYRIQPEYTLLYKNSGNTSSTLTEIHANVVNGYGIFTGLNSDTVQLYVYKMSM